MPDLLTGLGVGTGWAAGPAYRVAEAPRLPAPRPVPDPAAEADRAVSALTTVAAELGRRAGTATDPTAAEILRAQVMMAEDPVLHEAVRARVGEGADAPHAIDGALGEHRAAFAAAGGYLAERVADLDDLRDRAVAVCLGEPMPGVPDPGVPFILVARDLAPADTAGLDPARVLALVTAAGGPTSHTTIVARALGLPAVVRCAGILDVADGTLVTVDGTTGQVAVGVDADTVADTTRREQRRRAELAATSGPGRTADGHPVALLANIGSAADLVDDVEGVGLFRTELLYLDRTAPPGHDEQVAAYAKVFAAADGRKVVLRTLDAGADKPLPFLHAGEEPNPALGVRGLRTARRRPEVLQTQLAAIAQAAAATGADVWVMAPMVTTPAEAADFADLARAVGLPTVGAMVEVPAAALRAEALLGHVDFLSIGTNDLSQYTFAADRLCGDLADLLDPWQPALLELIAGCARAGAAAGKPVGVCGEAAADPALAVVLTGLGVSSLSMSARSVPAVRAALAAHTLDDCRRLAQAALAAPDATAARAAATAGPAEG
ncbi:MULTISPECIES: phosphoenolpyruvate--protein phosphotransferase [unclassified Solwaraspora]|uniref:phosphoenolpyruvate--protein phosphotransferase n=1 Tax=unclassified Solwaraspora TaxID=2627926 RepID=UPI00259B0624|nr:phosphoenolpyruvate--protein phosphotransferase [Solwaraspora sp. WMMA2056]WJK38839.1 phosphoenolpyruvate--protein phosphotransferase [Solwaraspora sp. WMMA2056]